MNIHFNPADLSSSVEEVACYFGGPRYAPDAETHLEMENAVSRASRLIAPAAALTLHRVTTVADDGALCLESGFRLNVPSVAHDPHARYLAVAIGSLGNRLETSCRSLAGRKDLYQSVLPDAVGTAMLDRLNIRLCEALDEYSRNRGLFVGARFSPGLEGYPLEQQRVLFQLADETAGVSLNATCTMKSAKSVSFFRLLSSVKNGGDPSDKCRACRMIRCRFRVNG